MTFSPTPASERGQVKIYGGERNAERRGSTGCICARIPPNSIDGSTSRRSMPRDVDARDLRRAEAVFQENLPRSFGIELADLSRDRWSVIPKFGDLVAEMNTDRAHLTYMKSTGDPEDIRFFDRTRSRTIAIYPSKERLATRGPFFSEDDSHRLRHRQLRHRRQLRSAPRMDRGQGHAAGDRAPRPDLDPHPEPCRAARRAIGRQPPAWLSDGAARQRSGRRHHQSAAAAAARRAAGSRAHIRRPAAGGSARARSARASAQNDFFSIQPLPSYIYTGRSGWYPQGEVTDYATANAALRVPEDYSDGGERRARRRVPEAASARTDARVSWLEYRFSATQPVRYLGWATSRFVHVDTATFSITPAEEERPDADGRVVQRSA